MMKECPICDEPFKDGGKAIACMLVTFRSIPSDVTYAVEHPEKCVALVHVECFDAEDYEGDLE